MKHCIKSLASLVGIIFICSLIAGHFATVNATSDSLGVDWRAPLALEHPLVGKIYDSDGAITPRILGARMADSAYVLIGEKHDNIDHHQLELYLLELLAESATVKNSESSLAVTLEMLDSTQQENIESVAQQLKGTDISAIDTLELKQSLDWPEHGWPWSDYAEIIGWTFGQHIPLYAGNISRQTMRTVHQDGLDERFLSARELRSVLQDRMLDQVYDGHCGLMSRDKLAPMLDIQLAKDSAMANVLADAEAEQSVLIAGTGHTRKDTGVAEHLRFLGAESILSVALVEVNLEKTQASEYDLFDRYDVVVFTPIANQRDYCVELEKSMKKN